MVRGDSVNKQLRGDLNFWESAWDNKTTYIQYYRRLTELAVSMFEYKNLPETMDERYLELALFTDGMAVGFQDDVLGYLGLRCMISGTLDIYNIPTQRNAYAANGYNKLLDKSNSVIFFNNYLHTPTMPIVDLYAKRLYNLDRAIDVNTNAQKTPVLITCDESRRLTMKNLYKQYTGNEPVIYGTNDLKADALQVLKTDAPYVSDKLFALKTQLWNEALTVLGISNLNINKKERLLSDEVVRSEGATIASRYGRLEMRRKACEQMNKMFGLNIEVDYRQDYRMYEELSIDDETDNEVEGGDEDE